MDKIKKVKVIGNIIGFNIDASGKETYNVQFPDMTVAELKRYQFEEADAYHTNDRPRYLRNVLARLRELPEHDRNIWLKGIMGEFDEDFSHVKWREGYEQGKFDGAVEAEKSKVVIPQFVADWIEGARETAYNIRGAIEMAPNGRMKDWLELNNVNIFAEAWVNGYEVEQEKRYKVKIPNTMNHIGQTQYLCKSGPNLFFCGNNIERFKFKYTRKELEDAGFSWVFDCEGVEVQEVE